MPNPLAEIQSRSQAAASTSGPANTIDKIVGTGGGVVSVPEFSSVNSTVTNSTVNTNFQSTGRASFSSIKIPTWTPNYSYEIGEIFRRGNSIYFVESDHISQGLSDNFYLDWLQNMYVRPMGKHPGQILSTINMGNYSGAGALLADGSEYLISLYPDLYRFINYGYTPNTISFDNTDVSNESGYLRINKTNHGFYQSQIVEVIIGIGGGTFANEHQTLFVRVESPNHFWLTTKAHTQVTYSYGPDVIPYSANAFNGIGNQVISRPWGVSTDSVTKFRIPDFRGIFLSASGINSNILMIGRQQYSKVNGSYMYDRSIDHSHYYYGQYQNGGNDAYVPDPNRSRPLRATLGVITQRANETEVSPANIAVNYYIYY